MGSRIAAVNWFGAASLLALCELEGRIASTVTHQKPQRHSFKKGNPMSLRKERQEFHLAPHGWRDSIDQQPFGSFTGKRRGMRFMIALLFAMLFAGTASAQQTATVSVLAPAMPVLKKGIGMWEAQREACVVTVVYSDGKKHTTRAPIGIPVNEAVIPETFVRGVFKKAVDACVSEGVLDNGDHIKINLPREPVVLSRLERRGLKLSVVMVAVPIDCPTVLTRSNGERYEGIVTFLACEAHAVGRGARLADATTTPDAILKIAVAD
jgi:hypothetical protein